jgi:hypothetical protein
MIDKINVPRKCRRCNIVKNIPLDFYKSSRNKSGYENTCKKCRSEISDARRNGYVNSIKPIITVKTCPHCKTEQNICEFSKHRKTKDGYCSWCRTCKSASGKIRDGRIVKLIKPIVEIKRCPKCKQFKNSKDFDKNGHSLDGLTSWCRKCINNAVIIRKYGITSEQKESMLILQNHKCASCGVDLKSPKYKPHVDHNHLTGKVRGILCSDCNRSLGIMKEDPNKIYGLLQYSLKFYNK